MSEDGGVNTTRRRFLASATTVVGAAGAVGVAVPFIGSWNPSAKAKAAGAPVTADLSKLEPGAMVVVEWRGKPVYVVRRTQSQIDALASLNDVVSDPESEKSSQPSYISGITRSRRPELLVVIGLCTHLGCAPKFRPEVGSVAEGWIGGFFCPCHGSKFDLAGRVYKGVPAPFNLEVPPYYFKSDNEILIGEDGEAA